MAIIDFNSVSGVSTVTATSSIRVGSGVTITSTSIVGVSSVAVGTSNPTSTVDIFGQQTNTSSTSANAPTGTLRLAFEGGNDINSYGSSLVFSQRWWTGATNQIAVGQISGVKLTGDGNFGGGLAFFTSNGSNNNLLERARINSSGQIGIGTTSTSGFNGACDDVVISGSSDVGFTLYSTSTTGTGSVAFTDTISSTTQGAINYFHNGDYMIFQTNASERMRIDSSGRMTLPYQPASCVYNMSASVNTGSESTWQLVKFQNSTVNRGSAYSSSTGLYTCPVAGVYFVSAFFLTRSNAAHNITIYKNGAGIGPTGRDITPSGEQNTGIMAYVDCAANDNLAIYFSNGSGGDFYVAYNYALFSLFG